MSRDFSKEVKRGEKVSSGNSCRICGITRELSDGLQYAHIYGNSLDPDWKRVGSLDETWKDDAYVSSQENCLLLCTKHHRCVDSTAGRSICSVEYLQSLKTHLLQCTAVVKDKTGAFRRCRNSNGRGTQDGDPFRCHMHLSGGVETLKEETLRNIPAAVPSPNKAGGCILL